MSVNFQQNIRSEDRMAGITLLSFFAGNLIGKHDTCRMLTQTARVIIQFAWQTILLPTRAYAFQVVHAADSCF